MISLCSSCDDCHNRRFKDQKWGTKRTINIVVPVGKLAETLASHATKGSLISIDGELRTRKFEKNGQTNYVTEVLPQDFESRAQRAMRENNAGRL